MELFKALGLNLKILFAQLVNFTVLVFVLWKWGYKPIFKFMNDRKAKIEKGVEDAKIAQKKLKEAEKNSEEIISKAKQEAAGIIVETKKKAEEKKKEIIDSAKKEVKKVIDSEKDKLKQEKVEIAKELKKELASLVVLGVEKILKEKINGEEDKKIIKKVIKELN